MFRRLMVRCGNGFNDGHMPGAKLCPFNPAYYLAPPPPQVPALPLPDAPGEDEEDEAPVKDAAPSPAQGGSPTPPDAAQVRVIAKREWANDSDQKLNREFRGDENRYVAYKVATAMGRARILGRPGSEPRA